MPVKVIMNQDDMRRSLARMAHEILERNSNLEAIVLIGIRTRGVPLAKRLAANIALFEKTKLPVGALDIGLYRDDLASRQFQTLIKPSDIPVDIDDKIVILVDDVLYTGRSTRAAMDALMDFGRPKAIQLAVLVDRGHRELPIRADYVGKNIPSSDIEDIQVKLFETDGTDGVTISSKGDI